MTHPKAHSVLARRLATFGAIGALLAVSLSTSTGLAASPSAAPAASPAATPALTAKPTPSVTAAPAATPAACVPTADTTHSVARIWDEAALDAIRRDLPRPTVHARNLFHVSAAMWDAWAAYDPVASGYFVTEKLSAADRAAARAEAISYAAFRVLTERYAAAIGGPDSLAEFDATMASLCYPTDVVSTDGDSPAALGNRIAAAVIAAGLADGSNEANNYAAPDYVPVNKPLVVALPGTKMIDPNRWQPLALDHQLAQNNVAIPGKIQLNVTPFWGHVTSFGLPASAVGVPVTPAKPPKLGVPSTDAAFKAGAVEVIRLSGLLDPTDGRSIDISPGSMGNDDLGTNDGTGYSVNPATGRPYAPNVVPEGDFARVLAEFWADGPNSETPPGHWNVIANSVADAPGFERRLGGIGPVVDPLEWDVKTYLALNGALHDAAIAAWGTKGYFDTVRPISMIRYMGGLGQSSDPHKPSYNKEGLPLVPGLIELITKDSSRPGQRHAALRKYIGQVAIKTWQGNPADPATEDGGVGWIRAVSWVPYQKPTFVTPAFSGYVSGHSTFSRAAAEVLTSITGNAFFPGGLSEWTFEPGKLSFEKGPSVPVTLQWATYYDAADQAGRSRLYGGIHVPWDDFQGRFEGSACGFAAWALAQQYYAGTATRS